MVFQSSFKDMILRAAVLRYCVYQNGIKSDQLRIVKPLGCPDLAGTHDGMEQV
jgi:hypothetical protein